MLFEIIPLEVQDPELGELLKKVVNINKQYKQTKKKIVLHSNGDVEVREIVKKEIIIGRNDKCYCGSGKKYKKCCLK